MADHDGARMLALHNTLESPHRDTALLTIEQKFLDFARCRAVGPDPDQAMRLGRFAAHPDATAPDLFGSIDIAFAAHILRLLDRLTDENGRAEWIRHILSFQGEDGWFRSGDKQNHGVEHATAYALGALQLLSDNDRSRIRGLKPLAGMRQQLVARPDADTPPFALSMLDRVHFWRGSHRAGGLAAIIGAVSDLGMRADELLGLDDPQAWLQGWWRYFACRADPRSGYWRLAPNLLHAGFDLAYRRRHDPVLASMGGAVHLYWVSERLRQPMPHPAATIRATAALLGPTGLYEDEPYCIDLDGNFLIARALPHVPAGDAFAMSGREALRRNRRAVVEWFSSRPIEQWNASSHKLPGAFAAVAEADRILTPSRQSNWRDVFEVTWWL